MSGIKVACPAKINLTLEIVNKREDGFHNIKSIMHTINLYDYLNISAEKSESTAISLGGNSTEIPYNKENLVYKATNLFLEQTNIKADVKIFINKNIPVSAGLAGGSTDAAGTLYGLNENFEKPLTDNELHALAASLGSDLNVCLEGGCILATSRGEKIEKLKDINYPVTLIKPKKLGISAKEAYTKYSLKGFKPKYGMTEKMLSAIENGENIRDYLYNDLEYAVFDDYKELQRIKEKYPEAVMSGSGSTYFRLSSDETIIDSDYQVINNLSFTNKGIVTISL